MVWISKHTLPDDEYTAKMQVEHPEWFDVDGSWLPTALTGARGPAGKYITTGDPGLGGGSGVAKLPEKWEPTLENPLPYIRCTHISPTGRQCQRKTIPGGDVCEKHGGHGKEVQARAEQVLEAARERLLDLIDPATEVLKRLVTDEGVNDSIQLKAATEILDRTGMKGAREVNVQVEHHSVDWTALLQERLNNLNKTPKVVEAEIIVEEEE